MSIRVELVSQFRDAVGSNEILVEMEEGNAVYGLIEKLTCKCGKGFKDRVFILGTETVSEDFTIVLDGRVVLMPEAII